MIRRASTVRNPGWWGLPSGQVESGEAEAEAVQREIREELGIEVAPQLRVWTSLSTDGGWMTHWWTATTDDSHLVPNRREVEEARWCTRAEIDRLDPLFSTDVEFFREVWPASREGLV